MESISFSLDNDKTFFSRKLAVLLILLGKGLFVFVLVFLPPKAADVVQTQCSYLLFI